MACSSTVALSLPGTPVTTRGCPSVISTTNGNAPDGQRRRYRQPCGQAWDIDPAHDHDWTVLDDVPAPMDQRAATEVGLPKDGMRVETGVSSPEPAVGVFTTAGTCQGRLRRHS